MNKWIWILLPLTLVIASCEDKEIDDLAKAQACLDAVPQSAPSQADDCMQYIEKYSSQQANIIKCGIKMTSGGLVEDKIVRAANLVSQDGVANKEAVYMSVFALDNPDVNGGYTKAVDGNVFCQASGVPGFQYVSSLVLMGSTMAKMMGDLAIPVDLTDPTSADPDSVKEAVTDLLTQCNVVTPPAGCTNNFTVIGGAVTSLGQSYCNSQEADSEVCAQITSAIDASNGDPANVGQALLCYLNGKTFNGTQCVP